MTQIDRYAVIGYPIDHSLSPRVQAAAFASVGLSATYEALSVAPSKLHSSVRRLRETPYRGFNVTIPHKEAICSHLDRLVPSASQLGAVNTVVNRAGELTGHNTDVTGFAAALHSVGFEGQGRSAIVFGAGGAARSVVRALSESGARVTLVNRGQARAEQLARDLQKDARIMAPTDADLAALARDAALVVNATPLGMGDLTNLSPLPDGTELSAETIAVDLVYGHNTPFLAQAASCGCRTLDGIEMLVQQGAEAFRLWTGIEPDLCAMREACLGRSEEASPCSVS